MYTALMCAAIKAGSANVQINIVGSLVVVRTVFEVVLAASECALVVEGRVRLLFLRGSPHVLICNCARQLSRFDRERT